MRKAILMLGTLLIATILISGSAMATYVYIIRVNSYNNCTNPNNAVGSPDGSYATIGVSGPPTVLGNITLDFGLGTSMNPNQNFTVYGCSSGETETYEVYVIDQEMNPAVYLDSGEDTTDEVFTTPSNPGKSWRFVFIDATSGSTGGDDGDTIYGPEIDAVGYDP